MKHNPSKKTVGGHAYGRRHLQTMSNTLLKKVNSVSILAILLVGFLTIRCDTTVIKLALAVLLLLVKVVLSFDIDRLLKRERKRALKFWSQVDISDPDECWLWNGTINKRTKQPQFAWRRHGISSSTQHHPQRIAMWFTLGRLGIHRS